MNYSQEFIALSTILKARLSSALWFENLRSAPPCRSSSRVGLARLAALDTLAVRPPGVSERAGLDRAFIYPAPLFYESRGRAEPRGESIRRAAVNEEEVTALWYVAARMLSEAGGERIRRASRRTSFSKGQGERVPVELSSTRIH